MLATFFAFTAQFILASAKINVFQTEALPYLSAGLPTRQEQASHA